MSTQPASDSTSSEIEELARPLRTVARALEVVAFISAIGGVIGGIALATVTTTTLSTDVFGTSTEQAHPYVGVGIALAIEAVVAGLFFWAVARGLQLFAVDAAVRHGVDLDAPVQTAVPQRASSSTTSMPGQSAGWYPDAFGVTGDPPRLRYWNGDTWTAQTREAQPPSTEAT